MFPGFASEFFKLDSSEKGGLIDVLLHVKAHYPDLSVILSVAEHSTTKAVSEAQRLVEAGADALNLLPSFFSDAHPAQRRRHVEAVLEAAGDTPVILQYAPQQTGSLWSVDDFALLAERFKNFRQVKVEATPPGPLISQLASLPQPLHSIIGYAGVQMIDGLERGAVAVQPGSSFTELYLQIWDLWQIGQKQDARDLHQRLLPYISYWMQGIELIIQAEKTISQRRGLITSDTCRRPGRPLDEAEKLMIDRFLAEFFPH
jgi:4-hydroxy-tetrahydrodipicolinate synthase